MMYTDLDTKWETWSSGHRQPLVNDVSLCSALCDTGDAEPEGEVNYGLYLKLL